MTSLINNSFTRFLLVGMLNTLVGLSSIYLLLHLAGLNYWLATFAGNAIGAVVSYFLNKTFTFRSQERVANSAWKFLLVILTCYAFSYWVGLHVMAWTLEWFGSWDADVVANIAVLFGSGLYTVTNYFGHKYFTFRTTRNLHSAK